VLNEEAIKLGAGRIERALLFLRTVMHGGTSVFMDCIAEKPVRRHFSARRVIVQIADDFPA
jgi:hypothetical protein